MGREKNKLNPANDCGRKEDLVTYLYGETEDADRISFERHLDDCAACRDELTAFGRVRDNLSAWQVGSAPRSEIVLQRSRIDVLRELMGMFPVWVRGAAIAGLAATMLLLTLSFTHTRISLKNGDFAIDFGRSEGDTRGAQAPASQDVEKMVQNAVAREREKIEGQYTVQLASFKNQLDADHQAKLHAANLEHQAQIKAIQAGLKQEMRKFNRQNTSIRSFFAMDDSNDPWGDVR